MNQASADTPRGDRMPGMTPSVRIVTDARDLPVLRHDEADQQRAPAPEVTVARLLACNASVAAVCQPPE
jgi:hypothetical protein